MNLPSNLEEWINIERFKEKHCLDKPVYRVTFKQGGICTAKEILSNPIQYGLVPIGMFNQQREITDHITEKHKALVSEVEKLESALKFYALSDNWYRNADLKQFRMISYEDVSNDIGGTKAGLALSDYQAFKAGKGE